MSDDAADHCLPDDPADWPTDPCELLGVSDTVDPKALRKRYVQLIRVYKPEQLPDAFRRIRAAYEAILQRLEWRQAMSFPKPLAPEGKSANSESWGDRRLDDAAAAEARQFEQRLAEIWQQACDGDIAAAFAALRHLHCNSVQHTPAARAAILTRLYWLAITSPELTSRDEALGWLIDAYSTQPGDLRPWYLYEREVISDRSHVIGDSFAALLNRQPLPPLDRWCHLRWHAAAAEQQWAQIDVDLRQLKALLGDTSGWQWHTLLAVGIDYLAWSPEEDDLAAWIKEIGEVPVQRAGQLPQSWDRIDFLQSLAVGWRELQTMLNVPPALVELIPLTWYGRRYEVEPRLVQFAEWLTTEPTLGLRLMDRIWAASRTVVAQLSEVFEQYTQAYDDDASDETLRRALCRELFQHARLSYEHLRPHLLKVCCREAIAPRRAAAILDAVEVVQQRGDKRLSDLLRDDGPLQCAAAAYFMFWS